MDTLVAILLIIFLGLMIVLMMLSDNLYKRRIVAVIIPIICLAMYLSWQGAEEIKGHPTTIMPINEFEILAIIQNPPKVIYYLISPLGRSEPMLIVRPWTSGESKEAGIIDETLRKKKRQEAKIHTGERNDNTLEHYDFREEQGFIKREQE